MDPVVEQSILDAVKTIETVTFEEPEKIEIKIEPVIDQSVLDAVKTIESVTFEEPEKVEELKTEEPEIEAEEHVLAAIKEIEARIPEVRVDDIEQAVSTNIEEASTVAFEEVKEQEAEEEKINEPVLTAIEHLEIGKPLDFSLNEKHSFQEWLQLSRTEPIDRSNETFTESTDEEKAAQIEIEDEERRKKAEIIDKFIETNPKIPPIKPTAITPTVQLDPNKDEDNSYLMTETLARVYLEQKKYTKAIQAYEILILKYPEKISFFADRISDIKILQQNNNNNN
nr:tetratricopeptide repeat protein [Flavobacterium sp. 270]